MIENQTEYNVTSAQLERLKRAVAVTEEWADPMNTHQVIKQAVIDGMKSLIADLEAELAEYKHALLDREL